MQPVSRIDDTARTKIDRVIVADEHLFIVTDEHFLIVADVHLIIEFSYFKFNIPLVYINIFFSEPLFKDCIFYINNFIYCQSFGKL